MPLSKIQVDILRLLASHRNPESYIAGATALNRNAPRYSADIDIFHDREERVAAAALEDGKTLDSAGYGVLWLRQLPLIYTAEVARGKESTRLEWVADSDFRFFPTVKDESFGYVLHPVDLATNKVMAAAGRRELRDLVDTVTVHEAILPLGAVIWAAGPRLHAGRIDFRNPPQFQLSCRGVEGFAGGRSYRPHRHHKALTPSTGPSRGLCHAHADR